MFVFEILDCHREGSREQADLMAWHTEAQQLFEDGLEFLGKELIGFIHNYGVAFAEIRHTFVGQVQDTTWGTHLLMD